MEVKILKETERELEFELIGEDHTFCNLLKEKLNSKKNVLAAYRIEHPLIGNPKFYIKLEKDMEVEEIEEKTPLDKIRGLGEKRIEKLNSAGITYAEELLEINIDELSEKTGLSKKILKKIINEAKKLRKSKARAVLKEALEELKNEFNVLKNAI
ncbi:MAG: hypothetical protein DRN95_07875 [Candidatus Hydrothermarchaeota archaeon]|nr:MAG: hypothetical protein DRN95_07875 [Candidatus Hydrothermarchaeota archaeon]RLG57054.1 MAG: hypothetical protein DRN88_03210 [Candidatus Hydrothermarchaeota archaeon]